MASIVGRIRAIPGSEHGRGDESDPQAASVVDALVMIVGIRLGIDGERRLRSRACRY